VLQERAKGSSFDSLTLESSIIDKQQNDSRLVSNEFDGAHRRRILDQGSSPPLFQTFLNKYYPSYIEPAKIKPGNQNFSFVITTKKVDEVYRFLQQGSEGIATMPT